MISNEQKYKLYRPRKHLGQNFLVDDNIAKKIIRALGISENDFVLEIGPGQGALTKHLIEMTPHFIAVEIDSEISAKLKEKFGGKLNVINRDFLKFDLLNENPFQGRAFKIIGSIPYNITSEILFHILDSGADIERAVIMIQKEVAERLSAKPNTKQYGILAVQVQAYADVRTLFTVPPTAFFPKPEVNSAVVEIKLNRSKFNIKSREVFRKIVRVSFGKRRKTLRNSLKEFLAERGIKPEEMDFDFGRRPENLSVSEFAGLSDMFDD